MKRNWNSAMRGILFLLVIIIVSLFFAPIIKKIEGFSGLYVTTSPGNYPKSVNVPLLDDYPLIGKNEISYNNYSDDWKSNQSSSLASYKQTTNNYKFFNNPDNGLCTGAEFCISPLSIKVSSLNSVSWQSLNNSHACSVSRNSSTQ